METVRLKLVTVIAEPVLEEQLVEELHRLGARGHTIAATHGAGSRGIRASDPPGAGIRIEVVVGAAVGAQILEHVAVKYFPNYAVFAFTSDVDVVRGDKYV